MMNRYFFCAMITVYCIAAFGFSGDSNNKGYRSGKDSSDIEYKTDDVSFISDYDKTRQKYVIMSPAADTSDKVLDMMVALHGYGSDRWQFIKDPRGECAACRDVAIENGMIYVSPDYRLTNWMGLAAEADVVEIMSPL
jgi:hypothetical protein